MYTKNTKMYFKEMCYIKLKNIRNIKHNIAVTARSFIHTTTR